MKTFAFSYQPSNYSFNNQEHDDEMYGDGNAISFDARMLDPRLGRWLSLDPMASKYAGISPYNFSFNNPIIFNDPDGKDGRLKVFTDENGQVNITLETTVHLYGKDSKGQAAYMNKAYHDAGFDKTRNFKVKDANGKETTYNVTIKVTYSEVNSDALSKAAEVGGYNDPSKDIRLVPNVIASADDLKASDLPGFKAGDNVLEIDLSKNWEGAGMTDGNGGVIGKDATDKTKIHEPFHFLGFPEGYFLKLGGDGKMHATDKSLGNATGTKNDVMNAGEGYIYNQADGQFILNPDFHISAYHYYQVIQHVVKEKLSGESVVKGSVEPGGDDNGEEFKSEVKKAEDSEVKTKSTLNKPPKKM